ncbi:PR-1-like protein, partial [Lepidopterella palustris CBS 459.81]
GGPNGENLASGFPNASASIAAWDNESSLYNFASPKFSHETGHFTQLVWKATTTIGCSHTFCNSRPVSGEGQSAPGWYVVCEYYPPGNVEGEFGENVQAAVKG